MGPSRVAVVGYDGAELLEIACVTSTFAMAGRLARRDLYEVELLTLGGLRATTHWRFARQLAHRHPSVQVDLPSMPSVAWTTPR